MAKQTSETIRTAHGQPKTERKPGQARKSGNDQGPAPGSAGQASRGRAPVQKQKQNSAEE